MLRLVPLLAAVLTIGQVAKPSGMSAGGPISPDGKTEVTCDYPVNMRVRNTGGSDGAGLCVFTSIMFQARWQDVDVLRDFQAFMKQYPGGGYPQKVDKFIKLCAEKQGKPAPAYMQVEGGDPTILDAAIATGRMVGVTYAGHDVHYGGSIAHMVCLVHIDAQQAVILDNNFIGPQDLVWMSREDFLKRWRGNGGGWAVVLLAPPPLPIPRN